MFLEVNNLHKTYNKTKVLRGLEFSLESASDAAIVGSSGSGKSTLLYILGALEKPDQGSVIIDGQDITKLDDKRLARFRNEFIGFIFQFHFLLPSMNCIDNILLPAKIGDHKVSLIKDRAYEFAKILKVEHCLKKFPFEISGGEQQRINIIRAISLNPKILLCDEPTGNLDSKNTQTVLNLLKGISEKIDSTLIVVTHDVSVSNAFERKITIEDGQIIS